MRWFTWFKPRRLDDGDFQAEIESHLQMLARDERVEDLEGASVIAPDRDQGLGEREVRALGRTDDDHE